MANKQTIWNPDTCDCSVVFSWDNATREDERVHTLQSFARKCDAHAGLDDTTCWQALHDENQTKNKIVNAVAEACPELYYTVNEKGATVPDPTAVVYRFDAQRNLQIDAKELDAAAKVSLQAALDATNPAISVKVS